MSEVNQMVCREGSPQSPSAEEYFRHRSASLATLDPASLRYIKVRLRPEMFPPWIMAPSNGIYEQTSPMNPAAKSVIDSGQSSNNFQNTRERSSFPLNTSIQFENKFPDDKNRTCSSQCSDRRSSFSRFIQSDMKSGSAETEVHIRPNKAQSLLNLHQESSTLGSHRDRSSKSSLASTGDQNPGYTIHNSSQILNKSDRSPNQCDKMIAYSTPQPNLGRRAGETRSPSSDERQNNTYIVRSTLYYNTSTQTELANVSDPASQSPRLGQVSEAEVISYSSPKTTNTKGKDLEEKSIQTSTFNFDNNSSILINKYPTVEAIGPHDAYLKRSPLECDPIQTSTIPDTRKIQGIFASRGLLTPAGERDHVSSHLNITGDHSVLAKHPGDFSSGQQGMMVQRQTSLNSSHELPQFSHALHDMPHHFNASETKSYNSMVGNHDRLSGHDWGSVSSNLPGSRHSVSSLFSQSSQRNLDFESPACPGLDHTRYSPHTTLHFFNNETSSFATKQPGGTSASFSKSPLRPKEFLQFSPEPGGRIHDLSFTSGVESDISSIYSNPRVFTLDQIPSRVTVYPSNMDSSPRLTRPASTSSPKSPVETFQWRKIIIPNPEDARRGSDSVFLDDDMKDSEHLHQDEDLDRTLTSSKDSVIFDQIKRYSIDSSLTDTNSDVSQNLSHLSGRVPTGQPTVSPNSRVTRYSECAALRQIKEESGTAWAGSKDYGTPKSRINRSSLGDVLERGRESSDMYRWRHEAWLRNHFGTPTSNINQPTSGQIPGNRPGTNVRISNYVPDSGFSPRSTDLGARPFHNNFRNAYPHISLGDSASISSERKRYHRKTSSSRSQRSYEFNEQSSLDSSSSTLTPRFDSESVAEVISKTNETIARSAQRVCCLRRHSSSSSRNSADFSDSTRSERGRRETDWTRLRSLAGTRYSPDSDRWSSHRSSLVSENLSDDINMLMSSTPRVSSPVNGHKNLMQDQDSHDVSMDSGLVISPTYRNFPSKRRPPPPPPTQSSSPEPPAIPPRRSRGNQQASSEDQVTSRPTMTQETTKHPRRKSPVQVIPLGRHQDEDVRVDHTQINFKDLMSQWKNSSPGDTSSPGGLRKPAQKSSSSHNHLQQPHQEPFRQVDSSQTSHERARAGNLDLTNKHGHIQKPGFTSPTSSALLSPSSSSSLQSPSSFSSSIDTHSSAHHNSNSLPFPHHLDGRTTSYNSVCTDVSYSIENTNITTNRIPHVSQNTTATAAQHTPTAAQSTPKAAKPTPTVRTLFVEYARSKSSSDLLSRQPPDTPSQNAPELAVGEVHHPKLRERSSSEYDILSEKRPPSHLLYQSKHHVQMVPDSTAQTGQKHQSRDESQNMSKPRSLLSDGHTKETMIPYKVILSQSALGMKQDGGDMIGGDGFAEGTYIGHKNKSSRAVGTYTRSTSVAALPSGSTGNYGDDESRSFPDSKLGRQSWSSELVLSCTGVTGRTQVEPGKDTSNAHNDFTYKVQEYPSEPSTPTPVRPPRPSTQGRHKPPGLSLNSPVCVSQTRKHASVSLSALDSVVTPTTPLPEPSRGLTRGESHRRAPPDPPASPPYDPTETSALHDQNQVKNRSYDTSPSPSRSPGGEVVNNILQSQHSPQRRISSNDASKSNSSWTPFGPANTTSPSHSTISYTPFYSPSPPSLGTHTPRDYQNKITQSPISTENKAGATFEDLISPTRYGSDSMSSTPRSTCSFNYSSSEHSRQPSLEELECDEKTRQLVEELEDKDRKLQQVLKQDTNKGRMLYMNGLFPESFSVDTCAGTATNSKKTRTSFRVQTLNRDANNMKNVGDDFKRSSLPRDMKLSSSQGTTSPHPEMRNGSVSTQDTTRDINQNTVLLKHKEELMEKLEKKLEVLREEKEALQREVADNTLLGQQVCQVANSRCQSQNEKEKFNTFIDDMEKIVRLLLNLSGQLARAENAAEALSPQVEPKLKKQILDKRDRLQAKHEEAKMLKENIDKRSDQILLMLQARFSEQELSDYQHFIKMKSKLAIEMQEVEDGIVLGQQQLVALRESLS